MGWSGKVRDSEDSSETKRFRPRLLGENSSSVRRNGDAGASAKSTFEYNARRTSCWNGKFNRPRPRRETKGEVNNSEKGFIVANLQTRNPEYPDSRGTARI